jgi:hypothetical protein
MALAELTETSTREEINAYVEQVVEEVAEDRAGTEPEPKSDARIAVEHANNEHKPEKAKEIPAEGKSGSKPAKAEAKAESGDEESDSWMDDDLKAEVAAYGIEESELADFASREELERAMRLFDKSALVAGKKALAEAEQAETGRNEKGQFLKKEAAPAAKTEGKPAVADGKYEIKLSKDVYDEAIVDEITGIRDHYDSRLERLEARLLEVDAQAQETEFDSAIDKLDMPKLFGVTGKETPAELKKREEVMAQAMVLKAGYKTFGRDVEMGTLVSRAAPMVFSSEFDKHNLKNRTRKISKQSNGRQGGGATRPQDPREDPREEADRRYKELAGS